MRVPTRGIPVIITRVSVNEGKEGRCYMRTNSTGPNLDGRAAMLLNKWYLTEMQRRRN